MLHNPCNNILSIQLKSLFFPVVHNKKSHFRDNIFLKSHLFWTQYKTSLSSFCWATIPFNYCFKTKIRADSKMETANCIQRQRNPQTFNSFIVLFCLGFFFVCFFFFALLTRAAKPLSENDKQHITGPDLQLEEHREAEAKVYDIWYGPQTILSQYIKTPILGKIQWRVWKI